MSELPSKFEFWQVLKKALPYQNSTCVFNFKSRKNLPKLF